MPVTAAAPLDAAQQAYEHTRRHLFPFRLERWVALGFVAFLDQCGRSGGGSFNVPGPGGFGNGDGGGGAGEAERILAWLGAHVALVAVLAAIVLAFIVAFVALLLWINSRAVFMYTDDVATGRPDVARPWREHAAAASSYFAWSFGLSMATLSAVLLLVSAMAASALLLIRGRPSAAVGIALIVVLALLLLGVILAAALASLGLRDFVAPLQLATARPCGEAIGLFLGLVRAHPGVFAVYVLLKIMVMLAVGVVALVVGCLTCCCGFLPVVAQTILQPAYYFERAWPLYVLSALGYALPGIAAPPAGPPPVPDVEPISYTNNTVE
jgi:hypothetical protein